MKKILCFVLLGCTLLSLYACGEGKLNAEIGDTVKFGSDGKNKIEWKVIDKKFDRMLLISNKALGIDYDYPELDLTPLYNKIFSNKEKEKILTTSVSYIIESGEKIQGAMWNTTDSSKQGTEELKLFILDDAMCDKYIGNGDILKCEPPSAETGHFYYYLGTKIYSSNSLANGKRITECTEIIDYEDGRKHGRKGAWTMGFIGVRPAMWVSINN